METLDLEKLLTGRECAVPCDISNWGHILAPYLESALVHSTTYSSHEIHEYTDFFINTIASHLGPAPSVVSHNDHRSYRPVYPSSMTNDLTPFELSLCWKHPKQDGRPIVRFVTDILPQSAEKTRAATLLQSTLLIKDLMSAAENNSSSLTLHVLPELWNRISETLRALEPNIHPRGNCSQCGPSSAFIGFDLANSVLSSKFYWLLPSCLGVHEVLEQMDKIFASCAPIHEFFGSSTFFSSWLQIRDHISRNPETARPRMLSVDATSYPAPRIKIYVRCQFPGQERAFETWEDHLHLNDKLIYPDDFMSTCRNLWTSLATGPEQWAHFRPDAGPKYCLVLYEVTSSLSSTATDASNALRPKLSSKLYIMCQEIPRADSVIAAQILRHCKLAADSKILKVLAAGTTPTNFISEIGLAPRKEGTEVSIYLNPSLFARNDWATDEDGYMIKPRITLPA